jgi:2-methylisocitrate lyase-like PEP mutase family enzyme
MANLTLKERLQEDRIIVAPGAFDMVSAKIIENLGFEAIYITGFGQSASHLGLPDAGFMTLTEIVERIKNTSRIVKIPLIGDGDTGYGGIVNVKRTVEEFEGAGASAIQLEDQEMPKKCGHVSGKRLVEPEEMVLKIQVAIETRQSDDFLVIARTDARTVLGFEEAITRAHMYEAAGADIIFIESPQTKEEFKIIGESLEKPALANMIEGGRSPSINIKELQAMGFKLVIFPVTSVLTAAKAVQLVMQTLKNEGTTEKISSKMMEFEAFTDFIGFQEVRFLEDKYSRR